MLPTIPKLATFAAVAVLAGGGSIAIAAAAPDPGSSARGAFGGQGGPGGGGPGGPPNGRRGMTAVPSGTLPGNGTAPTTARSTGAGATPSNGSGTTP